MSTYLSHAPMIQALEAENRSAFPDAPQLAGTGTSGPRSAVAALLRRAAEAELALAARLERRPAPRRLAAA